MNILLSSVWSTVLKNTSDIFLLENSPMRSAQSACANHFYRRYSCTSAQNIKVWMGSIT